MNLPVDSHNDELFNIDTPLGFSVRTTVQYWEYITAVKHPTLLGQLDTLMRALSEPDQIRQSRTDDIVYLFYHAVGKVKFVCAVVKDEGGQGFLITAYYTNKIKRGNLVWKK